MMRGIQASVALIRNFSAVYRNHTSASLRVLSSRGIVQNRTFHCTSFMQSTADEFQRAKQRLGELTEDPGNATKLELYALFKQATVGPCTGSRPGMTQFVARAKWDAWNALGQSTTEEAQKKYIAIVNELAGSAAASGTASTTESSKSSATDDITIEVRDKMHIITFNRPTKKNAIKIEMYDTIVRALETASKDNTALAVITGAGDFYCSGNDLSNFSSVTPSNIAEMAASSSKILHRFVKAFIDFPKPLVVLVNGPAVGISVTVMGLCDAVYATDCATFHTPFTSLGQSPEGCSTVTFPQAMGHARACELLLFNKKITAAEAKERGIVTEVFADAEFQKLAWERVKNLARLPPGSLRACKEIVRAVDRDALHAANAKECEVLTARWQSDECAAAIMEFFKRKQ